MFCSIIHIVDDESATGVSGSVGRVQPCQGWGRGFESRLTLFLLPFSYVSEFSYGCQEIYIILKVILVYQISFLSFSHYSS